MNINLLENSIKHHGKELFDLIAAQNEHDLSERTSNDIQFLDDNNEIKVLEFNTDFGQDLDDQNLRKRLLNFISKKSDILFSSNIFADQTVSDDVICLTEENSKHDLLDQANVTDVYDFDIPPLETFMGIPLNARKEHLFDYIKPGDIVIGCIVDINYNGLSMQMICFDNSKRRDISNFKFNLFCPYSNAIRNAHSKSNKSDKPDLESHYSSNNFVRCIVVNVDKLNDTCEVSFEYNQEFSDKKSTKLGLIEPETLPAYFKNIQDYQEEPQTFAKYLRYQRGFNNPACVKLFGKKLGCNLNDKLSLMKQLNRIEIKKEETAEELLKRQNKNLALEHVHKGVTLFKEGKSQDAILNYQKALQIDEDCVEALVARGALNANQGDFVKSIEDLEKSLKLDPNHSNATKYLKEVFLAYSVKFEKSNQLEEAKDYLKKALDIDPENEIIKTKLKDLVQKIEYIIAKNHYGPSLPRGSDTEKNRKRSSSRERDNYSREKLTRIHSNDSRYNSSNNNRYDSRRSLSTVHSSKSDKYKSDKHVDKKSKNSDEEEDLEAFYNQLKQKKASMAKKK